MTTNDVKGSNPSSLENCNFVGYVAIRGIAGRALDYKYYTKGSNATSLKNVILAVRLP